MERGECVKRGVDAILNGIEAGGVEGYKFGWDGTRV